MIEVQQKMEKPKRQLKVVFPRNESILIIFSSRNGLKGEQQVPKSVAVPEVNRTAAKFNGAELARVYFDFSAFKSLSLLLGLFFSLPGQKYAAKVFHNSD